MIEYIVGITKRVKKVENNIPPNIVIPTVSLLAAPGPVPNINGKTPNIVDKLVINIGLNLITEALIIASSIFFPSFLNWFANSTMRIPFFAESPISIINALNFLDRN